MLTVYLVEHIAYLFLRKTFGIQHSGQSVALFFLVAEYGQYLWVEVAVAVAGYTVSINSTTPCKRNLKQHRLQPEKVVADVVLC